MLMVRDLGCFAFLLSLPHIDTVLFFSFHSDFRFGQLYNSQLDANAGMADADKFVTTNTVKGYLSDGNSHKITVNGGGGGDTFDVLRNKAILDLNGQSGDDIFVVQSFLYLEVDADGETAKPDLGKIIVGCGTDDQDKCKIIATGSSKFIDFSSGSRRELESCGPDDGYDITMTTQNIAGGQALETLVTYQGDSKDNEILISHLFHSLEVIGSECDDTIHIVKAVDNYGVIDIHGQGGNDEITVGSDAAIGLDGILNKIIIKAGDGSNKLILNNAQSIQPHPIGVLTSSMVSGLTPGQQRRDGTYIQEIEFEKIEVLEITLSSEFENEFTMISSLEKFDTTIWGSTMSDKFYVQDTQGDLTLHAGSGGDEIFITGLGDSATAVIYGDAGEDYLEVDGSGSTLVNTLNTSTVRWNGGNGSDKLKMFFTSTGNTVVDIFGDNSGVGVNSLQVECVDFACTVLSRATFIANIANPYSTERINFDSTGSILKDVLLNLNGGENKAYFDDTMAPFDVYGGVDDDGKRSGIFRLFIVFAAY
jgi:hypothetical protein